MIPPGTESGDGHSEINIPPIAAAHIGVSKVIDAVVTEDNLAAERPNKSVGNAVEITPNAIKNTTLFCVRLTSKVGLFK